MCDSTPDPRDAVSEATSALVCLMLLTTSNRESVPCESLSSALRIILDRLEPAAEELHGYVPRI